jgi:hypothetical protein
MQRRALIIAVLALLAIAIAGAAAQAQAKPKTWHRVITMSGGEETFSGQYHSRVFRLYGGRLKLDAHVTPDVDPDYPDDPPFYSATFNVDQVKWSFICFWATLSDDNGMGTDRWWTFKLPKGRYTTYPNTYGCTWTYTLYEKR